MGAEDDSYVMRPSMQITIRTSDVGNKTPQTVKFDAKLGSQIRTYSYPYSTSNTYEWNSISDFNGGADFYSVNYLQIVNARVEFTDGSSSVPKDGYSTCEIGSQVV